MKGSSTVSKDYYAVWVHIKKIIFKLNSENLIYISLYTAYTAVQCTLQYTASTQLYTASTLQHDRI